MRRRRDYPRKLEHLCVSLHLMGQPIKRVLAGLDFKTFEVAIYQCQVRTDRTVSQKELIDD